MNFLGLAPDIKPASHGGLARFSKRKLHDKRGTNHAAHRASLPKF
jgi:hypothetical protein